MRRFRPVLVVCLASVSALLGSLVAREKTPVPDPGKFTFARDIVPFIKNNCLDCHQGDQANAGLQLHDFLDEQSLTRHRKTWLRIAKMLRSGLMPPEDGPKVPRPEAEAIATWLTDTVNKIDCSGPRDPGRVTIRRLNRQEYNHTIRDLLGVDFRPADDFPADDVGYGFDNIGDVLSLPPLLMEKYLDAAEKIAQAAVVAQPQPPTQRIEVTRLRGGDLHNQFRVLASVGEVTRQHKIAEAGEYVFRVQAYADQAGGEVAKMEFRLDGQKVKVVDVSAEQAKPAIYEAKVRLAAREHTLGVAFINDYYQPRDPNPNNRDRNLHVGWFELIGPLGAPPKLPPTHTRLITVTPGMDRSSAQCAKIILKDFAGKAYRRPVSDDEVERLVRLVQLAEKNGETFERGIQLAVQAVLVSPHFLFRIELDAEPGAEAARPGDWQASVRTLNEHELATRLSYFLWSSMPDDELRAHADAGTLRKNLHQQVDRLLDSPKSWALVENFAGQWLQLRNLETFNPDRSQFPEWNGGLRTAMRQETEHFFAHVLRENRSIFELLDADYTYVNGTLARLYGLEGIRGPEMRRVELADKRRGGVLTQASVLAVTSNPTRTSPVKRGRFILEQILGADPPPPPAQVELLKEDGPLTGTLRQRMEQHRRNPNCAICHRQMDPLGFGLENFNAVGKWRDREGEFAIDASGELPDGRTFNGPAELKQILLAEKAAFRRCLSEKLLTYALGRGLEYYDKCTVDDLVRRLEQDGDRLRALIHAIVDSAPFQKRRGKRGDE